MQNLVNMFVSEKEVKYSNPVLEKSFEFGVRIVRFYLYLGKKNKNIQSLLKQILRSGTSIGANITEAQSAVTKKDFINKLGIALKESKETDYWLRLLKKSEIIEEKEFNSINQDCLEIIKLLTSIIKSSKTKI
jgi:four helix bundle protein